MTSSIRVKLIRSNVLIISWVFIIVLLVISMVSFRANKKNLESTQEQIRNSLIAKGQTLVINNSMALRPMAGDNAILDVRGLVQATVEKDRDIVYGIYMQGNLKPWVIAKKDSLNIPISLTTALADSMSVWASMQMSPVFRACQYRGEEVLEFTSPVMSPDDGVLGFIRYGLTTRAMKVSLQDAQATAKKSLLHILLILAAVAVATLFAAFIAMHRQASRITRPIYSLVDSAKKIAGGDYSGAIQVDTNDEIGTLSRAFETMRQTVKNYTEHLQDLVDEKMQQVRDIMNNIDQGLFTINLDLGINPEYSLRANEILGFMDITQECLQNILRLSDREMESMHQWIKLIEVKHTTMRWQKLAMLAPVQEIEIKTNQQVRYVRINYQKILDKAGVLHKVMILAQDITQSRLIEARMEEERIRHENEVKTILGIVGNTPEVISDFIADTENRLSLMIPQIDALCLELEQYQQSQVDEDIFLQSREQISTLFRDLHTIKGNAGTYGFEILSLRAHESESLLEKLKTSDATQRPHSILMLQQNLKNMLSIVEDIKKQVRMLAGEQNDLVLHIARSRIEYVQNLCEELSHDNKIPASFKKLAYACQQINYKTVVQSTKKYKDLVKRVSDNLEKDAEFELLNPTLEIDPKSFEDIDEAIVHIMRNAIDHGIESSQERNSIGKGPGKICMDYQIIEDTRKITISDDGKGIEGNKLVERAMAKGILDPNVAALMTDHEKCQLIFMQGLSTANHLSTLSGRGLGMDIARDVITKLQGNITVDSQPGKGTTFTILVPNLPRLAMHG